MFFEQSRFPGLALNEQGGRTLRVVVFRSENEYEEYRLRTIADAYYVSDGTRDYIVMASWPTNAFSIAAHEYFHYVLHASGLKLPVCLNEGLAEYFSTLRFKEDAYELGGDLPARTKILRGRSWLPLPELFALATGSSLGSALPDTRKLADIFYAESWALTDMLAASPQYASHFRELVAEFVAGSSAAQAFAKVYGQSLDEVTTALRKWVGKSRLSRFALNQPAAFEPVPGYEVSSLKVKSLLADVSLVSGHVEQARIRYAALLQEEPNDPHTHAALGVIAGRQGNREENLKQWREAIRDNSQDADLCYRYALLAEDAGVGTPDVKAALERAIALAPAFDDARYKLALLEGQAGEYRREVEHLRAMRVPEGARRFAYWLAMAAALTEVDERGEAKEAAQKALNSAGTEEERSQARQQAYIAATDLKVQFVTDSAGQARMVTTRVEHGEEDWNPFIEPSDHIQHAVGSLAEVLCKAGKLSGFLLRTKDGAVMVDVPDPLHVLIRNGPGEFYCGPMNGEVVETDYAVVETAAKTKNVLRGMTFSLATRH